MRFTLVELMIVVAIIGILAAIAIPSFHEMQLRAKYAEVPLNLDGISMALHSYARDRDLEGSSLGGKWWRRDVMEPSSTPTKSRQPWPADSLYSSDLGFRPDGNVYAMYEHINNADPVELAYWVVAHTDLDGDGDVALTTMAYPDSLYTGISGENGQRSPLDEW